MAANCSSISPNDLLPTEPCDQASSVSSTLWFRETRAFSVAKSSHAVS